VAGWKPRSCQRNYLKTWAIIQKNNGNFNHRESPMSQYEEYITLCCISPPELVYQLNLPF
jgi:hypothetical protein